MIETNEEPCTELGKRDIIIFAQTARRRSFVIMILNMRIWWMSFRSYLWNIRSKCILIKLWRLTSICFCPGEEQIVLTLSIIWNTGLAEDYVKTVINRFRKTMISGSYLWKMNSICAGISFMWHVMHSKSGI